MKFKIGKYYQHGTGRVISIIGTANTFFHGSCLLAEEEDGRLMPVGEDEDAAQYWHEVSGWKRSCYDCNNIPDPIESTPRESNSREMSDIYVGDGAPRICQACDHGGSINIFHGAPVFCRLHKEIKKFDETCRDWKLIFSQHDEAREEEKCVVRTDLCNEREARKAAESKLAEAREQNKTLREALLSVRTWGINSKNWSATHGDAMSQWIDDGCAGELPPPHGQWIYEKLEGAK
jgi:hypothetical protein